MRPHRLAFGEMVELSGGLDSAIVLGALVAAGRTARAVNFATLYPGGDERRLARDAADLCGTSLVELCADERELDFAALLDAPHSVEPLLYGLDPILEHAVSHLATELGHDAIMTGQGGDAVFFQSPTVLVAVDHWLAGGSLRDVWRTSRDAATRAHCSIWKVGWRIVRDGILGFASVPPPVDRSLLSEDLVRSRKPARLLHPWLRGIEDIPPAKRAQLTMFANGQIFVGPTLRGRAARLIHPLLAQPMLEAALAIPCHWLANGLTDRAMARRVFADRLPSSIARRSGKGETQIYYGRAVIYNLSYLRALLLDGFLVASGFINRSQLERALSPDTLLWRDIGRRIAVYASFEAWARYWRR